MLGNIIAKILAGSVVGYVTNYLAIQMLFKEYLKIRWKRPKIRFGLGGVIVKERKEFEAQISRLVESDVIHHQAVEAELKKANFEQALQQILQNLFQKQLPQVVSSDLKLQDIPCLESSFQQVKTRLVHSLEQSSHRFYKPVLAQSPVLDMLSDPQIEYMAGQTTQLLQNFLEEEPLIDQLFQGWLRDLSQHRFSDFMPASLWQSLGQNIDTFSENLHQSLRYNYAPQIDDVLEKSQESLATAQLIQKLSHQVADRKLYEIFSQENVDNVPKAILGNIQNLFQSDVSEDIIQTLLRFLLNVLKEENATVYELLSDDLKQNFERFLENKLPDILATLIPWIRQKKKRLEQLIQDSFRENTSSIGQLLVAIFIGNIGKYIGIEQKLIDLIEKQDVQELAKKASDYLQEYLRKNTIGDLIKRFQEDRILQTLTPVLQQNIEKAIQNLRLDGTIHNLFDKPVRTWFSEERIAQALNHLLDQALHRHLKENWIFTEKSTRFFQEKLRNRWEDLLNTPLQKWLPADKQAKMSENLLAEIQTYLLGNQEEIQRFFARTLEKYLQEKHWDTLIRPDSEQLKNLVQTGLEQLLDRQFARVKEKPLHDYIQQVNQIPGLDEQLSRSIKAYLLEHLPQLMEGRIEQLVKENLAKQPDTRLRDMVHKAMGEELRPLSFFGGFLGTITGALLLGIPEMDAAAATLAVSGIAYGITGWGTNWLAIKMLFRPYNPVKIFGTKQNLPFTPGVVAKHKARFAKSMGRFLGDRLLNQENLQENFAKNQPKLEQGFRELFSKDDYAFIQKNLSQNQEKLAQQLTESLCKYLDQNSAQLAQNLAQGIEEYQGQDLRKLDSSRLEKRLLDYLDSQEVRVNLANFLSEQIQKARQSKQSLQEVLPKQLLENISQSLTKLVEQEIIRLEDRLENQDILELLDSQILEERIAGFLENNLEEILNREQEDKLKEQIFDFLKNRVTSDDVKKRIYGFIDDKLKDEFAPGKNIKDFFGGRLMELLEKNLNQILERVIQMAINWLQANKEKIANQVYEDAYAQNSLAWTYKNSIKATTQDLIERGVPNFLKTEFGSLEEMIHEKVQEVGNSPFNTTNFIALDSDSLKRRVEQILTNTKLLRKTRQLTNLILEERIFKIRLNALFKDDPHQLMLHLKTLLDPEIHVIQDHLRERLHDENQLKAFSQPLAHLLNEVLEREFLGIKAARVLATVDQEEAQQLCQQLVEKVLDAPVLQTQRAQILQRAMDRFKSQKLEEILDIALLQKDLPKAFEQAFAHPQVRAQSQEAIQALLETLTGHLNQDLSPETKDFTIDMAAKAIFGALETHILTLINSINFKEIVVGEIETMHAQELENLFYGFARKYFKYLIGYGFVFGIIFGLAIDFGLLNLLDIF